MKVTFVSNYINHHQVPFCEAMYERLKEDYCFIQTAPMEEERVKMGWDASLAELPYVRKYYEEEAACRELIEQSEIVLFGGVEEESYIEKRLKIGKPVIRLSERIYKEGQWKAVSPRGLRKKYKDHTRYRNSEVYLLCCGGYVASDFHIIRAYPGKMFRWGYFPAFRRQDVETLLDQKRQMCQKTEKLSLLWAGRFIDWKHPEYAIHAAKALKEAGISFQLNMVGGGEMEAELKQMAAEHGLTEEICFRGFQKPEEVRAHMEQADIFLLTSDYKEGWGAVLNEAMNSACAIVAGHGIGAVPYLLEDGRNGLVYKNGEMSEYLQAVLRLATDATLRESLGRNAYETVAGEWNAKAAAERLLSFCEGLLAGKLPAYQSGPMSPAPLIPPKKGYTYTHQKKSRIYVCHTFYHVYVSLLKEFAFKREAEAANRSYSPADIALSTMSTDFGKLGERLIRTGVFNTVITLEEKREDFFPKLAKYRQNYHNILKHLINRMIFTKKLAKCQIPYMTVDFKSYQDIYVFCDSDPIGYYLNYKKIPYHAVEDGLDCLKNLDDAYVANSGHFKLKTWFSRHNLIFIMNGWGKYCLDMEINDRSKVPTDCPRFVEVPRKPLEQALTPSQKKLFVQAFVEDAEELCLQLGQKHEGEEFAMVLTEAYPEEEDIRKRVCLDMIEQYCQGYRVLIKPHPRDRIEYSALCPDAVVLRGRFPIEVLNFIEGVRIKRAVSVITSAMDAVDFVEEKINLGASFWDAYEDPEKHAFNKKAGLKLANETVVKS